MYRTRLPDSAGSWAWLPMIAWLTLIIAPGNDFLRNNFGRLPLVPTLCLPLWKKSQFFRALLKGMEGVVVISFAWGRQTGIFYATLPSYIVSHKKLSVQKSSGQSCSTFDQ
jgi:hypothetical protein